MKGADAHSTGLPASRGPDVEVLGDAQALAQALAHRFADACVASVRRQGTFRVALAGGTTPAQAYALLAAWPDPLPWGHVHVFWGDERPVPPDHPDSNYRMAHEALLAHVPVPPAQVHRLRGEAQDLSGAAAEYALELADAFGIPADGPPPRFDLVLLGMGAEGHTASLFPASPVLASRAWVASPFVPALGMRRLTLTPAVLNAAAQVVFAVGGVSKAAALGAVLHGQLQPDRYPAQVVRPVDGRLQWLVQKDLAQAAGVA